MVDMMQQIVNDTNKMMGSLSLDSTIGPIVLKLVTGDRLQRESQSWLTPPDPSPNYNIAREIHQDGTATWFCEGSVFAEWNAKGSLLWIYGKRGFLILALR